MGDGLAARGPTFFAHLHSPLALNPQRQPPQRRVYPRSGSAQLPGGWVSSVLRRLSVPPPQWDTFLVE